MTASLIKSNTLAGVSYGDQRSISSDIEINVGANATIPAAKAGSLTTRTDNDTGEITLTANPSVAIATGDIVDVYWATGHRRGMTVGTVAGLVVPIDGGAGDNLPSSGTAVTVMKRQVRELRFDGDNLQVLLATGEAKCIVVLTGDDDVEDLAIVLPNATQVYEWFTGSGVTNPVAGDAITKAHITHGDATAAKKVKVGVGIT